MKTAIIAIALIAATAHAEIYQWTDSDGKIHYSDTKPTDIPPEKITVDRTKETPHYSRDDGGLNLLKKTEKSEIAKKP